MQQPLDLSNYLFIRTRERLLLENKVNAPQRVLKSGKPNKLTLPTTQKSLSAVQDDLTKVLPALQNMLYVLRPAENKQVPDLPVAFATNALYILERNSVGQQVRDVYEGLLLPVLKAKSEYLHAEGVAQAVWALANAELVEDKALWSTLKKLVLSKDFNPVIVKNERWTASQFTTTTGCEHFFESELNDFANQLFFQEHMNLFEVYNGLRRAHGLNKELGLEEAIKHLETQYGDTILRKNNLFLEIEATHNDAVQRTITSGGQQPLSI